MQCYAGRLTFQGTLALVVLDMEQPRSLKRVDLPAVRQQPGSQGQLADVLNSPRGVVPAWRRVAAAARGAAAEKVSYGLL